MLKELPFNPSFLQMVTYVKGPNTEINEWVTFFCYVRGENLHILERFPILVEEDGGGVECGNKQLKH